MNIWVYRDKRFNRSLIALKEAGGKAALAAERAEEIITGLISLQVPEFDPAVRMTRHGELRVKNCRKYNLGSGYRLIGISDGANLVMLYIGSHDDCDRWLENNRGFSLRIDAENSEITFFASTAGENAGNAISIPEPQTELDYDDLLYEKIDEKILRNVFKGLCGG